MNFLYSMNESWEAIVSNPVFHGEFEYVAYYGVGEVEVA